MSTEAKKLARRLIRSKDLKAGPRLCLEALAYLAVGHTATVAYKELGKCYGVCRRTAINHIGTLIRENCLTREGQAEGRLEGQCSRFTLTDDSQGGGQPGQIEGEQGGQDLPSFPCNNTDRAPTDPPAPQDEAASPVETSPGRSGDELPESPHQKIKPLRYPRDEAHLRKRSLEIGERNPPDTMYAEMLDGPSDWEPACPFTDGKSMDDSTF